MGRPKRIKEKIVAEEEKKDPPKEEDVKALIQFWENEKNKKKNDNDQP